ncbi:MAG: hypothetical protein HC936_05875 [Leptolyngbyaceae cyanobacterium SU_3_3]|nr:hypothetical protein [Leptolyngbyaceae cyanobacterium SU_3_3]
MITRELTIDAAFSTEISTSEPQTDTTQTSYTIQTLVAGTNNSGLFYSLDQGETWINDRSGITNTAIRAILPPRTPQTDFLIGGVGVLLSPDKRSYRLLRPNDSLQVLTRPRFTPHALDWHLLNINKFAGILTTTRSDHSTNSFANNLDLQPAAADDEFVSELVTLLAPPTDQQTPILVFQEPLQHCYDPATVSIYANVVAATHGETIADNIEVLGSGDGNLANQSFWLKKNTAHLCFAV